MAQQHVHVTFRVRRIPHDVTVRSLAGIVQDCFPDANEPANVNVRSLARSPDDWDVPSTQTATIEFAHLPEILQDRKQTEWVLTAQSTGLQLFLDRHFLGFTQLNALNDAKYEADCIAISGLAGHPFGSWRQRIEPTASRQFMWLRDQLPDVLPGLRVMIYGFDTELLGSESVQNIDDLARSFVLHLKSIGLAEPSAKPLILLAHSLGGVIVKRATLYLAGSNEAEDSILDKVRMAMFFGVPNKGMYIKHLRSMVQSQPNESLVQSLSVDSPYLAFIDDAFSGIAQKRQIRIVSAFETKESRTAELQASGIWARRGPAEVLVTRGSAIHRGSRDPQDVVPVNQDHSDIVKFAPNDITFSIVQDYIRESMRSLQKEVDPKKGAQASNNDGEDWRGDQILISAIRTTELLASNITSEHSDEFKALKRREQDHLRAFWELRSSLDFAELEFRLQAIENAHEATFGWVFEKQDLGFLDWVIDGSGMYWIRGKPGSGKSTFMRYLYRHENLRKVLSSSNRRSQRHDLWFFFNERGSYLQKTMEGLLRTILLQLIDSSVYLAVIIFRDWLSPGASTASQNYEWTLRDLERSFDAILNQSDSDIEILLFLDALDEYQGFPQVVARWLTSLSDTSSPNNRSRTKVKICFASREWDAFVAAFSRSPGFRLHEHTLMDIQQYVVSRASAMILDQHQSAISTQPTGKLIMVDLLARTISKKAEGVFLWARFALDTFAGKTLPNNMKNIEDAIDKLPEQLDAFYTRTIERIPKHSRERAFVLLELMLRSPKFLTVPELFYAAACSVGDTYEECRSIQTTCNVGQDILKLQVELHNLCAGLLECKTRTTSLVPTPAEFVYVQFIHKTVKDFVGSPGFPELFLGSENGLRSENGHTWLMKYLFTTQDLFRNSEVFVACWICARQSERDLGLPATKFLSSIPDHTFEILGKSFDKHMTLDRITFAALTDMRLYVLEYMNEDKNHMGIQFSQARPLHAIASFWAADEAQNSRWTQLRLPKTDLTEMFKILIGLGFNPGGGSNNITPWDSLFKYADMRVPCISQDMIRIAEIMISIGDQDPDRWLHNGEEEHGYWQASRSRAALHVSVGSPEMVKVLLQNKADPNVLDQKSCSPMDLCIIRFFDDDDKNPEIKRSIVEAAMLLITAGGGVHVKHPTHMTRTFVDELEKYAIQSGQQLPGALMTSLGLSLASTKSRGNIKTLFSWNSKD